MYLNHTEASFFFSCNNRLSECSNTSMSPSLSRLLLKSEMENLPVIGFLFLPILLNGGGKDEKRNSS